MSYLLFFFFFIIFFLVNIVDFTTERGAELRSRETLLENGFIYVMGITSATGMPVELCNDDDFNSGNCDRGWYFHTTKSALSFCTHTSSELYLSYN